MMETLVRVPWNAEVESRETLRWQKPHEHPGGWKEIRAVFDRELTIGEALRAAGAIGYALREHLDGESLSLPQIAVTERPDRTVLLFDYDSTLARRGVPDSAEAFIAAGQYIVEGSPLRATDRQGNGTSGTRLCEGIGPVRVVFYVR